MNLDTQGIVGACVKWIPRFLDFLSSRGFPLRSVFQGSYERRFRLKAVHQRGMCSDDRWCPGFSRSGEREGKKEGNNSQ